MTSDFAQKSRLHRAIAVAAIAAVAVLAAGPVRAADDDIIVIPRAGNPGAGPYGTIYINQFDPAIARMNACE